MVRLTVTLAVVLSNSSGFATRSLRGTYGQQYNDMEATVDVEGLNSEEFNEANSLI
jgi:hypothetical protein